MKKLLLLAIVLSVSLGAIAQMGKVTSAVSFIDQGQLDKAKEALDQAFLNEKSMNNPKTFLAKGRLCQEVYKTDKPNFKSICENPLDEAYTAYEKALELDPKGSIKKQMQLNSTYLLLGNDFLTLGIQKFESKDYEGAFNAFESNIKVSSSDVYVGVPDSGIYLNAGLAAYNAKMYDKAVVYFQKCADMQYEGATPYIHLYQTYTDTKDMAKAEATLKKTFELYPQDKDVILRLVDFYINNNRLDEAFNYLNLAKAKNPGDHTLWWAEGVIYMRQEKYDDAITCLSKSIELNSERYETQFNMGVCYYNKAVEMVQKADVIMDAKKYEAAIGEANLVFIKAIPYFEKASLLHPEDIDSLKNLKELYFRLRNTNPEYKAKYDDIMKRLEGK